MALSAPPPDHSSRARVTLYDELPYDDFPFPETHPGHLAAIGALFGLRPAPPTRCRVLELGCGLGGNLLGMAAALPESAFVGVDASARQIDAGRADAEALGLRNLELRAADILDLDERLGPFDYIVCHGVYSWVPGPVRAKILALCRALLAPGGVAYVSYNVLPGWHLRGLLRDLLLREGPAGAPPARVAAARDLLALLGHAPPRAGAHALLHEELALLAGMSDRYLFHEHLAPVNHAFYFRDFAHDAARAGLAYVADAHLWSMMPDRLGQAPADAIAQRARGLVAREQLLDYMDLRFFRRTLLCHAEAPLDHALTWRRLSGLWLRSALAPASAAPDLRAGAEERFTAGGGELATSLPLLKAALVALAARHPAGLRFEALCAEAQALAGGAGAEDTEKLGKNLLGLVLSGEIDLDAWPRPCAPAPGPRPATTALARREAAEGRGGCTTLLHERVAVDAFDRALVALMDGTRTTEELARAAAGEIAAGRLTVAVDGVPRSDAEVLREITEQKLARLARAGLVVAT